MLDDLRYAHEMFASLQEMETRIVGDPPGAQGGHWKLVLEGCVKNAPPQLV